MDLTNVEHFHFFPTYFIGTSNVIQACLTHGVSRLVVTSTVDVNTGANEIFNGSEKNTQALPSGCVFPYYANAKYRAERITLDANNKTTEKGQFAPWITLITVCAMEWNGYLVT